MAKSYTLPFLFSFAEKGSALYLNEVVKLTIKNAFIYATTSLVEGAIFLKSVQTAFLTNLTFQECISLFDASAIYAYSSDLLKYFKEVNEKFDYIICAGDLSDKNESKGYQATESLLKCLKIQLTVKRSPKRIIADIRIIGDAKCPSLPNQ